MDAALLDVRSLRPCPVRPSSTSSTKLVFLSLAILAWVNSPNAALAKGHHGGGHKGGHHGHNGGHEHKCEHAAGHEAHHEHEGEHAREHGEHEGHHHDGHSAGWANGPGGYGYRYWNGSDWTWDYKRHLDKNDVIIEERRLR